MAATTEAPDVTATGDNIGPAPEFQPSPALVELHATAKRLERELNYANTFNPRRGMRLARARATANARWVAEVRAFEQAHPATTTPKRDES